MIFTDPKVDGYDCFDVVHANEIMRAYYERSQAAVPTGSPSLDALDVIGGDDAHRLSTWLGIQSGLQFRAVDYVNDDNATYDPAGDASILMHTLATWRQAAGLNAAGFRRVTDWDGTGTPSFSYGLAEEADIFGYWIYEDLIAGIDALRWTKEESGSSVSSNRRNAFANSGTCSTAVNGMQTSWATIASDSYRAKGYLCRLGVTASYRAEEYKSTYAWNVGSLFTLISHTADVYLYPKILTAGDTFSVDPDYPTMTENALYYLQTFASSMSASHTTDVVGDMDEPYGELPFSCANLGIGGVTVHDAETVVKWEFTRTK